jgi:hypothetical protein
LVRTETIKDTREATAKKLINAVNRSETSYFLEVSKFSNNFTDLQITLPDNSYIYRINILENDRLVQTLAVPTQTRGLRTYTGALSYIDSDFNSILCESQSQSKVIPGRIKLIDNKLNCPTGFKIIFYNVQQQALNGVGGTNRAQQAHFFETLNFTTNKKDLAIYFSETYYDYSIELLENDKLAQTIATPKFDNLKSYIGGIFYDNNLFKSIVCQSEEPIKDIVQSIALIENQLKCPSGFQSIEASN